MKHLAKIEELEKTLRIVQFDMEIGYAFTRGNLSKPDAKIKVLWAATGDTGIHNNLRKELVNSLTIYDAEVEHVL